MKQDYTDECIDIINKVIEFGAFVPKTNMNEAYETHPGFIQSLKVPYDNIYRVYLGPPKDVYSLALPQEVFESIQLDWAIWWAKEKGIISHHGPAGTKGWCLYTDKLVQKEDVIVGEVSPFCPSSMLPYMQSILKYSALLQNQAQEEYDKFDDTVSKIRSEVETEKDLARTERKLRWS